ncbi:MAG: copper amine oxidase N-terminal domain-containing protein [Moorellaceae bacterium]
MTIRVEENVSGSLNSSDKLKLKLPAGLVWLKDSNFDVVPLWGDSDVKDKLAIDGWGTRELSIKLDSGKELSDRTAFDLTAAITVEDESKVKEGDIVVQVSGGYTVSPTELIVGSYGEYDVSISAADPDIVAYAGRNEQDVSDIVIKEGQAGSLVDGRTITLTLPSSARWIKVGDQYVNPETDKSELDPSDEPQLDSDEGVSLIYAGLSGSDKRTLKLKVKGSSSNPAELKIEDIQVALEAGVTGDLNVEVGGTAGLSGTITLAKVVSPVSVKAEKANVVAGKNNQAAGSITISEYKAEAIDADGKLVVQLPKNVRFSDTPTVKVTAGDIEVDKVKVIDGKYDDCDALQITFKTESTEASTIVISNIRYDVSGDIALGDIEVKIGGTALINTADCTALGVDGKGYWNASNNTWEDAIDDFEGADSVAKVVNATVVSSLPGRGQQQASFQIGSTTYTVNGVQAVMDVAPYVKDGRTYLPVRYVAYALGIPAENIVWDGTKATFIGSNRVVQVTPGSNVLAINGAPVTMDVVAEIVDGRVMVPFRWVAQAFGAQVDWDEATQTVTMQL